MEKEYVQMATKIMESGILINIMAASRWKMQRAGLNGGKPWKDMEQPSVLMETDT